MVGKSHAGTRWGGMGAGGSRIHGHKWCDRRAMLSTMAPVNRVEALRARHAGVNRSGRMEVM